MQPYVILLWPPVSDHTAISCVVYIATKLCTGNAGMNFPFYRPTSCISAQHHSSICNSFVAVPVTFCYVFNSPLYPPPWLLHSLFKPISATGFTHFPTINFLFLGLPPQIFDWTIYLNKSIFVLHFLVTFLCFGTVQWIKQAVSFWGRVNILYCEICKT